MIMPEAILATYQINNEIQLLELAHSLGQPVPSRRNGLLIDKLIPLPRDQAHPQSLSANFGVQEFPFHTDGAYFTTPPRYIVLRYADGPPNPTPTLICPICNTDNETMENLQFHLWKVRSFEPFYASILSEDGRFFRFDSCIMTPISHKQNNLNQLKSLITKQAVISIDWSVNQTIIIDNWQTLHQRPAVRPDEVKYRTLQRIMIL